MSEKPKRRSLRVHLLSLVIMSLLTSLLMWLNLTANSTSDTIYKRFGWPMTAYKVATDKWGIDMLSVIESVSGGAAPVKGKMQQPTPQYPISDWDGKAILIDLSIALSILLATTFLSEYLIYCRKIRRSSV